MTENSAASRQFPVMIKRPVGHTIIKIGMNFSGTLKSTRRTKVTTKTAAMARPRLRHSSRAITSSVSHAEYI